MTTHQTQTPNSVQIRAGRKEWAGLAVLLLPLLMVSMDVSVLYFAVPLISRDLQPTSTQQLWIFDIYGFVLAGLLITMGTLGDRIGRRRLLLIGALAFSLASLGAAYSHTAGQLIAARAVEGIAGATLMPSTLALIRNMFHDERQRRTAIAIWTAATMSGVALGPVISGVLLEPFLVGLGLPDQRPDHDRAAVPRPGPAPRVPCAGARPVRPDRLAALARRRAAGDLRDQGDRRQRAGPRPGALHRGRCRGRGRLRPAAGARRRADDRPEAVPQQGVHRLGPDRPGVDVRGRRDRRLHHPVPRGGAGHAAADRRRLVPDANSGNDGGHAGGQGARPAA